MSSVPLPRAASERVELALAALDATAAGFALIRDGRVVATNAAFAELTGVTEPRRAHGAVAAAAPPRVGRLAARGDGELRADVPDAEGAPASVRVRLGPAGDGRLLLTVEEVSAERRRAEELARRATHDALTGLPNRRLCAERLAQDIARAGRHGRPLCLAVLDLDHFKRINDTHGHPVGDRVLHGAARRLAGMVRPDDVFGRIGGEEFAWVLAADALAAADRARAALTGEPVANGLRVTATVGICALAPGDDAAALYARADHALYWGKAGGRDTTLVWTPEAEARVRGVLGTPDPQRLLVAADAVDDVAGDRHARAVAGVALAIAAACDWSPDRQARLHRAARLHDVGKAVLPDALLALVRTPTPAETALLGRHAALGAELARPGPDAEQAAWIRHHHERWDGGGGPDGLTADGIPDGAQLIAIADAFVRADGGDGAVVRDEGGALTPRAGALLAAGLRWRDGVPGADGRP